MPHHARVTKNVLRTARKTTRRQDYSSSTKRALLDSATTLFTDHGYAGTSLDEVVAAARVTKGALYHHFPSKLALFESVFFRVQEATTTTSRRRSTPPRTRGNAPRSASRSSSRSAASRSSAASASKKVQSPWVTSAGPRPRVRRRSASSNARSTTCWPTSAAVKSSTRHSARCSMERFGQRRSSSPTLRIRTPPVRPCRRDRHDSRRPAPAAHDRLTARVSRGRRVRRPRARARRTPCPGRS